MKNNDSKMKKQESRSYLKQLDINQFQDPLELCFLPSIGQAKKINPIENKSLIIDKLINFLKTE